MIFRLLIGQVLRANPDETPAEEILLQIIDRMSQVNELQQTTQVLGPLIYTVEVIPEEDMTDLDFINEQVVVDETGIDE